MIRVLSAGAIDELLDLEELLEVVAEGTIAQYHGDVERPERPHFPVGAGLEPGEEEPLGTGLAMPAYVHGSEYFVTKIVGAFEGNRRRGLPTINASVAVVDARTGQLAGLLEGARITNARTGCIGGLAARALTQGEIDVGVLGAGAQARWQTRAIDAACPLGEVRIYSPSDSREECAADLRSEEIDADAVETPEAAVETADVVVTATTSHDPVFPASALRGDAVVIAVGAYTAEMQEIETAVVDDATQVFADVPEEVAEIGDLLASDLDEEDLVPLGALLAGDVSREDSGGLVLVESVGSAVFDAVTAEHLYEAALEVDVGVEANF